MSNSKKDESVETVRGCKVSASNLEVKSSAYVSISTLNAQSCLEAPLSQASYHQTNKVLAPHPVGGHVGQKRAPLFQAMVILPMPHR